MLGLSTSNAQQAWPALNFHLALWKCKALTRVSVGVLAVWENSGSEQSRAEGTAWFQNDEPSSWFHLFFFFFYLVL